MTGQSHGDWLKEWLVQDTWGRPLYQLELIEKETDEVEALTSYVVRIADLHSVNPSTLMKNMVDHWLPEERGRVERQFRQNGHSINCPSTYADMAVRALTAATGAQGLRRGTLLAWQDVFSKRGLGLMRTTRRWCPECYHMDWRADRAPYDRLYWLVPPMGMCTIHEKTLCCECPACGREQPLMSRIPRAWVCDYCGCDFTSEQYALGPESGKADLDWESRNVKALIGASCVQDQDISPDAFPKSLKSVCGKGTNTPIKDLKVVGHPNHDVSRWRNGTRKPTYSTFASISEQLRVPFVDLLMGGGDFLALADAGPARERKVYSRQPHLDQRSRKELETQLLERLRASAAGKSLKATARDLNTTARRLKYNFPELSRQISEKHREQTREESVAYQASREERVLKASACLVDRGIYPTARRISEEFGIPRYGFRNPGMSAVLRSQQARFKERFNGRQAANE